MTLILYLIILLGGLYPYSLLESKSRSIGILVNSNWTGEYSFAYRIESAGKNLGWDVTILDSNQDTYSQRKFDWILTLIPDSATKTSYSDSPNYLVLFDPVNHYFDETFCLSENFSKYHGYLKTFEAPIILKNEIKKPIYPFPWYPSVQYRPYKECIPKKIFYFVGQWGNRCHDIKHKVLQSLLSQQDYSCFFGNPEMGCLYKDVYKGEIPYGAETIQDHIFKLGVSLVLHSDIHIAHKIPSGRIFEAAGSSSVIISDMNPFIKENFGDSVLYVDQTASGEEMFAQIDAHMHWILTHQIEAQQMAERSYILFCEKFSLEHQLICFDKWHQSLRNPIQARLRRPHQN